MRNESDTRGRGPHLSDEEMTQFKLDSQTSSCLFICEAAAGAEVVNPPAESSAKRAAADCRRSDNAMPVNLKC